MFKKNSLSFQRVVESFPKAFDMQLHFFPQAENEQPDFLARNGFTIGLR